LKNSSDGQGIVVVMMCSSFSSEAYLAGPIVLQPPKIRASKERRALTKQFKWVRLRLWCFAPRSLWRLCWDVL